MRVLSMREIGGSGRREVSIDDKVPIADGGFGTIYGVANEAALVVKHLALDPPIAVADIGRFTAHILAAGELLGRCLEDEEFHEPRPRPHVVDNLRTFLRCLSTHWDCNLTPDGKILSVWLLQPRAAGRTLKELFDDRGPPPDEADRIKIAESFVNRMRTLRRPGLVHLDAVADNVMVDLPSKSVSLIDLDGCGIEDRGGRDDDRWAHRPMTIGKETLLRLPPWYPQAGLKMGPKSGNFGYAERWVVLDTVIRILSWNRHAALTWLEDDEMLSDLGREWKKIKREVEEIAARGPTADPEQWWPVRWRSSIHNLSFRYQNRIFETSRDYWAEQGLPRCMAGFCNLAQTAFLNPTSLSNPGGMDSFYVIYANMLKSR